MRIPTLVRPNRRRSSIPFSTTGKMALSRNWPPEPERSPAKRSGGVGGGAASLQARNAWREEWYACRASKNDQFALGVRQRGLSFLLIKTDRKIRKRVPSVGAAGGVKYNAGRGRLTAVLGMAAPPFLFEIVP